MIPGILPAVNATRWPIKGGLMPEEGLVRAWRLGYDYGRAEAISECPCRAEQDKIDLPNVRRLDDFRFRRPALDRT